MFQINEEDESKASSRNSIHRQHGGAREAADEDRGREEDRASSLPTPTTSGTTVVQESARQIING